MIQSIITTILILILQDNTIHILNICAMVCPFDNNPKIMNTKGNLKIHKPHPSILWCLKKEKELKPFRGSVCLVCAVRTTFLMTFPD